MEFTQQELDQIESAEKAVRRTKVLQPMGVGAVLVMVLLWALEVIPGDDSAYIGLILALCIMPMIRSPRSPSYEELVQLLSKRRSNIDPLVAVLSNERS